MSQLHPVNTILEDWNRLEQPDATQTILPCNGSVAWAIGMVNARSFETPDALFAAADKVWLGLSKDDWKQAFDSHPRIGEHKAKAATEQSLKWSASEQSVVGNAAAIQEGLAAANKEYEQKFGRIFIVCATGKTAAEMLAILNARLSNNAATELNEAAEQQRQITQLRLRKWLGSS
jgi:2-oxo-4-hydroxy-4-carboxy-5-ureidoimidazoline decarboxylase